MEVFGKRSAARRDDSNVDRIAAVEADRAHLAGREHAVEPLLGVGGKLGDLVEDERSAVGLDELAGLGREGAREGAFVMAEQLAVDDVGGDRLAVEAQQRPLGAKAGGVDRAGDGFLAGARLADDSSGRRLRADLAATASAARNSGAAPTSCSSSSAGASFSETGASSPDGRRRSALTASASSSRSGATGRTRKSDAPARIASTAVGDRIAVRKDDDGQIGPVLAQRLDQLRALLGLPAAEDRGLHLAAVRPLEQGDGLLAVGGADDAPRRARGDGGDQSALVGIGVEQQERSCRFFAHSAFRATYAAHR